MSEKILIIAEKKSFAEDVRDAIPGGSSSGYGYFTKGDYIITWAYGHLLDSLMPTDYEDFGGWNWESIPYVPKGRELNFKPSDKTEFDKTTKIRQLKTIGDLYKNNNIKCVYNACDAGREGDLIFWEIYHHHNMKAEVKRLWSPSPEENDIKDAIANLKEEDFYIPRKEGAYARQYADWLLGLNLTIAFRVKTQSNVNIGRVQTPTLTLLVNRRLEIENFKPEKYYELDVTFGEKYSGRWFKDKKSETKLDSKEEMKKLVDKVTGKTGEVVEKEVVVQKENAKGLFNLGGLQKEANKKFGYTSTKTLEITQALYDEFKVVSYPRSDSEHLLESQVSSLREVLNAIKDDDYKNYAQEVIDMGIPTNKSFVDNSKVSDHYAIIPTRKGFDKKNFRNTGNVTKQELSNIYDLILRKFLSAFYPAAIYEKTDIVTEVEGEKFKTSGRILKEEGWKKVYGLDVVEGEDKDENSKTLPPIEKGEVNKITQISDDEKLTKPPSYHNDATLVSAMENARNLLDEEEKQGLKDAETKMELGTVATRGNIIDNLESRGYIERKGKRIIATDKGVKLIEIAPNDLKSPEITAEWERKITLIEKSKYNYDDFKIEIEEYVSDQVEETKNMEVTVVFEDEKKGEDTGLICPRCNKPVREKTKLYQCESSTREKNCLTLWKNIMKKKIPKSAIKQVVEKGETNLIKGFTSVKTGKKFDAKLVWKEDGMFGFKFENAFEKKDTGLKCNKCGNEIKFLGKFYSCGTKNEKGYCFSLPGVFGGKQITNDIVKDILEKGETEVFQLKGKTGKPYKASFKYDSEENKISMNFSK